MIFKKIHAFLLFLSFFSFVCLAQNQDSLEFSSYLQAKENVQLLKNDHFFIPIKKLEKENIAYLSYLDDTEASKLFLETLEKYAPIFVDNNQRVLPLDRPISTYIITIEKEKSSLLNPFLTSLSRKGIAVILAVFTEKEGDIIDLEKSAASAVIIGR